ncbi:hypothetical protein AVEN_246852-1 [Araneus ventricosus]|uniref:Uncharacterized protein n=1 Tax=Araneus ventricosus TaxID=182803 RepID=A0A4Y2KXM4_ARAVE|nr:hypothetical protein AVEN_246852-1 [Araneus ventricosus]
MRHFRHITSLTRKLNFLTPLKRQIPQHWLPGHLRCKTLFDSVPYESSTRNKMNLPDTGSAVALPCGLTAQKGFTPTCSVIEHNGVLEEPLLQWKNRLDLQASCLSLGPIPHELLQHKQLIWCWPLTNGTDSQRQSTTSKTQVYGGLSCEGHSCSEQAKQGCPISVCSSTIDQSPVASSLTTPLTGSCTQKTSASPGNLQANPALPHWPCCLGGLSSWSCKVQALYVPCWEAAQF